GELDARTQLDGDGLAVGGEAGQRRGELRHDVQLVVDVVELLADRGEDGSPDQGSTKRRVQGVGLPRERDPQRAAVLNRAVVLCVVVVLGWVRFDRAAPTDDQG